MTGASRRSGRSVHAPRRPLRERWLIGLEAVTGSAGLAGGLMLAAAPDGSLLAADTRVLASTPFKDWRIRLPSARLGSIEVVAADLANGLTDRGTDVILVGAGRDLTRASAFHATFGIPPSERLGTPAPKVLHAARAAQFLYGQGVARPSANIP